RRWIGPTGQLGHTALQRLVRDHALLDEEPQGATEPPLIIARAEVVNRGHPLDGVAELVDVAPALDGEPENSPFPGFVEDWLVGLALDAPEPVHATHVVDAVHVTRPRVKLCNVVTILSRNQRSLRNAGHFHKAPAGCKAVDRGAESDLISLHCSDRRRPGS